MTLRKATEAEFYNIARLYRRASQSIAMEYGDEAIDKTLNEDYLLDSIKEGKVKILVDKGKILAYIIYGSSIKDFFFPISKSSEKETEVLLKTNPKDEERHILIEQIMVDPFYQKKGYGKTLFFSVADQYRDGLVLTLVSKENKGAVSFLRKLGCLARGYVLLENHNPDKLVLISYRLHERTATYRAHNNIHAS